MRSMRAVLLMGCLIASLVAGAAVAQAEVNVGTVDLTKVRDNSPRFKQAFKEIDEMVADFEGRRDRKREKLDDLTEEMEEASRRNDRTTLDRRRREMADKGTDFQQFMEETFGTDGIIENKSSELLAPLYADLAEAGKKVAKSMGLDLILDLEQLNPLFADDNLDVTDAILEQFLKMR